MWVGDIGYVGVVQDIEHAPECMWPKDTKEETGANKYSSCTLSIAILQARMVEHETSGASAKHLPNGILRI